MYYNAKYMSRNKDAFTDLVEDLESNESSDNSSEQNNSDDQTSQDQVRDENGRVINLNINK